MLHARFVERLLLTQKKDGSNDLLAAQAIAEHPPVIAKVGICQSLHRSVPEEAPPWDTLLL